MFILHVSLTVVTLQSNDNLDWLPSPAGHKSIARAHFLCAQESRHDMVGPHSRSNPLQGLHRRQFGHEAPRGIIEVNAATALEWAAGGW
jgi:hypothetical protein